MAPTKVLGALLLGFSLLGQAGAAQVVRQDKLQKRGPSSFMQAFHDAGDEDAEEADISALKEDELEQTNVEDEAELDAEKVATGSDSGDAQEGEQTAAKEQAQDADAPHDEGEADAEGSD